MNTVSRSMVKPVPNAEFCTSIAKVAIVFQEWELQRTAGA